MTHRTPALLAALFTLVTWGPSCGESSDADADGGDGGSPAPDPQDDMANAFYAGPSSAQLGSTTNQTDCALCHSLDARPGFPGSPLRDIAYRSAFNGGEAPYLLYAVNRCIADWMGGASLLTRSTAWQSLESYLQSISDPSQTAPNPLTVEILANEAAYEAAYAGGNAAAGAPLYALYCGRCHDEARVLDSSAAPPRDSLASLAVGRIAQKVRTSGWPSSGSADDKDSTPGPMPFFEPSDLAAADLKDIIAHIKSTP